MMTRLFVYGTLRRGEWNHSLLESARFIGDARTRPEFELYSLGGCPGMVAGRSVVLGEVYEVTPAELESIDRLEGHPHFYERMRIVLADGTRAETYLLPRRAVSGRPRIDSGDWRSYVDATPLRLRRRTG